MRRFRGFTLIELLMVIVIIGILVTVLIPRFASSLSLLPAYNPAAGVSLTINAAGVAGWSGTATSISTTRQCFLFVGNAAPVGVATQEGQVACN